MSEECDHIWEDGAECSHCRRTADGIISALKEENERLRKENTGARKLLFGWLSDPGHDTTSECLLPALTGAFLKQSSTSASGKATAKEILRRVVGGQ